MNAPAMNPDGLGSKLDIARVNHHTATDYSMAHSAFDNTYDALTKGC